MLWSPALRPYLGSSVLYKRSLPANTDQFPRGAKPENAIRRMFREGFNCIFWASEIAVMSRKGPEMVGDAKFRSKIIREAGSFQSV